VHIALSGDQFGGLMHTANYQLSH